MPDITMCASDKHCVLAPHCYRSSRSGTVPKPLQSYADFNIRDDAGACVSFLGARNETLRREGHAK